ncbi:Fic family protein, partial [Patescibacteria group bacterium]|nr:Fic family protein [Patescibacteria group bacterium]
AFKFILNNKEKFKTITKINLEEIHKILIKDLNVKFGFRSKMVGVTGSIYHPLDNIYQISEAVEKLCKSVSKIKNPCAKALLSLLGVSYIQPFEDGNKRTARLITNAILLANNCTPLSYRSVEEKTYREAMLVFYEINSLVPFKKIFLEQYVFATENYYFLCLKAS